MYIHHIKNKKMLSIFKRKQKISGEIMLTDFEKSVAVIGSCKTGIHMNAAQNYISKFAAKYKEDVIGGTMVNELNLLFQEQFKHLS